MNTSINTEAWLLFPETKELLHFDEARELVYWSILFPWYTELKMFQEVGNGGNVWPGEDTLDLGEGYSPSDWLQLWEDWVFWREGGAKDLQSQPGWVKNDNVLKLAFTDVYNLEEGGKGGEREGEKGGGKEL